MGDGKFQCNTQLRSGGDEVPGKITVRNYTTLTDYAALLRAGMYLAGKKEEAEEDESFIHRMMRACISA